METIAITNWNGIVSPLYDASCCFMINRNSGLSILVDVSSMTLIEKADLCLKESVAVLICGAISNNGFIALRNKDIKVIPWIRGSISDIISAYKNDSNLPADFFMPGCYYKKCKTRKCNCQFGAKK